MKNTIYFVKQTFIVQDKLLRHKTIVCGVRVPQFQLAYIYNTNNPLHKILVKMCHDVHYI